MEYDFHKGDWVLCCANPNPGQFVKITALHTWLSINANTRNFPGDKMHDTSISIYDIEPIPIEPAVLEAFGFTLEYIADMCFAKLKFDDGTGVYLSKKGLEWVFNNNEPFEIPSCVYTVCCPVVNIHDIQHAMRVAGITKELEYKEK